MLEGEKFGGASNKGWTEYAPLVGMGLTDQLNIVGGAVAHRFRHP